VMYFKARLFPIKHAYGLAETIRETLNFLQPGFKVLVAVDKIGDIVGAITYTRKKHEGDKDECGYINWASAFPARKGYGACLVQCAHNSMKRNGIKRATAHPSESAVGFWKGAGYTAIPPLNRMYQKILHVIKQTHPARRVPEVARPVNMDKRVQKSLKLLSDRVNWYEHTKRLREMALKLKGESKFTMMPHPQNPITQNDTVGRCKMGKKITRVKKDYRKVVYNFVNCHELHWFVEANDKGKIHGKSHGVLDLKASNVTVVNREKTKYANHYLIKVSNSDNTMVNYYISASSIRDFTNGHGQGLLTFLQENGITDEAAKALELEAK